MHAKLRSALSLHGGADATNERPHTPIHREIQRGPYTERECIIYLQSETERQIQKEREGERKKERDRERQTETDRDIQTKRKRKRKEKRKKRTSGDREIVTVRNTCNAS